MQSFIRVALLASVLAPLPWAPALAADHTRSVSKGAVQVRKYGRSQELRLSLGSMPLDPFKKGWTVGLSHTHHFSDLFAWETLHVAGAILDGTSLQEELINTFARLPREFSAPQWVITTGFEIKPFYGKQVLFNRETIHAEVLFGVYAGVMFGDRDSFDLMLEDIRPSAGGGLGLRIHLSRSFSTRFDARLFASSRSAIEDSEQATVESVALLTLSLSWVFGDLN